MKIPKISESGISQALGIVQIIFMIFLLGYVYNLNTQLNRINKKLATLSNAPNKPSNKVNIKPDKLSPIIGSETANVTMTIFSDFECSFCKAFAIGVFPQLKEKYVDKGLMKVNFRHLPLAIHKNATTAAEASACVNEQGKFWNLHDYLFKNQHILSDTLIYNWAADNKLNISKLKGCIIGRQYKNKVSKDIDEARSAGIQGTPAIIINGHVIMGSRPFEYFAEMIDKELAQPAGLPIAQICN